MSDRDRHGHHDPDPAALAELQQAFADEETDGDADGPADGSTEGSAGRTMPSAPTEPADLVTDRIDTVQSDDPEAVVSTTQIEQVARSEEPEAQRPAILDADLPEVEPDDAGDDVVIVEHEPTAEGPAQRPRIIRIDDYGGSVELDDATPESLRDAGPAAVAESATPVSPTKISISDDELPDAVYVEGNLDAGGGGPIVIIDDDDTGDALAPDSERALRRGIEPRMRERRRAVRRAQGRKRLRIAVAVVAVVLVAVLTLAALGTFFVVRADDVRVFNAVYTDEEQLQEIVDDAVGTPVLLVDTTDLEERIEEIAWVERASVRTDFPHGLVIEIRERAAIATYQGPDGLFRVLDREGRVLDVLDLYPFAYVLVGGPDAVDLDAGEFAPQGYAAAAELAKNLTATVRGRVQLIEVSADGSRLVVYLDDGSTVFFGEARDLLAKLVRLEAVLANGQNREPGLIDVSTADVTR